MHAHKDTVLIIGAGPIGLATAIECQKRGLHPILLERGCLVNSIYHYPVNMTFFSTSERLEIGGVPFISHGPKPTRSEALMYYRRVAVHFGLDVRLYETVDEVLGEKGDFEVRTSKGVYHGGNVVVATGFYGQENLLGVPGEELPKVRHYYKEAHPHAFRDVLVVGGGNSAVDVALETWRAGARVTMVVRYPEIKPSVKYWVRPDIVNRIASGEIAAFFESEVREIREREVEVETPEGIRTIANDVVFAMIGYHPHFEMMQAFGIRLTEDAVRMPVFDPVTLETNRPGVFVAGVVCGGMDTSSLFIENSRVHAQQIAEAIAGAG